MEKLIELLNKYEKEKGTRCDFSHAWEDEDWQLSYIGYWTRYSEFLCISKKYWFIDWLVYKNKIDTDKCRRIRFDHDYTDSVLMRLAIQDEPISFLISILK